MIANCGVLRSRPGGDSHIKVTGVLVGFFESDPLKVPGFCFVGVAQVNFTPKRYQNKT